MLPHGRGRRIAPARAPRAGASNRGMPAAAVRDYVAAAIAAAGDRPRMKLRPSWFRILACGGALGLAAALLVGPGRPEASDPESGVRVAASVCEAQKLKRDKEWNPELQIEIPPQFDVPWPSLDA